MANQLPYLLLYLIISHRILLTLTKFHHISLKLSVGVGFLVGQYYQVTVVMSVQLGVDLQQKVAPVVSVDCVSTCLLDSYGFSDTSLLVVQLSVQSVNVSFKL